METSPRGVGVTAGCRHPASQRERGNRGGLRRLRARVADWMGAADASNTSARTSSPHGAGYGKQSLTRLRPQVQREDERVQP